MSESATAIAAALEAGHKGTPETSQSLLSGVSLPAAAIFEPALAHNLAWMQRFAESHGAYLAPHGKTTMTPALFQRQLAAGAWGITLATAPQCRVAFAHGVTRLLLANQLVGEANMAIVAGLIEAGADFYCVVDSKANAQALGRFFAARHLRLKVLIELGVEGGRCGCRTHEQVIALAQAIDAEPALQLAGMEGYEGVVHGDDPVAGIRAYAASLVDTAQRLCDDGLIAVDEPIITASGSAWYDLIAEAFDAAQLRERFTPVLRPGCYVVHDHGIYREAQRGVLARRADLHEGLLPALEVFAQVQSLPEPGLAIVALGKRDIGFDQLPEPLRRYREERREKGRREGDEGCETLPVDGWQLTKLMDQHAFIRLPEDADDVQVGDIVAFGASHPCLTFDKWRRVCLVDEGLRVINVLKTSF